MWLPSHHPSLTSSNIHPYNLHPSVLFHPFIYSITCLSIYIIHLHSFLHPYLHPLSFHPLIYPVIHLSISFFHFYPSELPSSINLSNHPFIYFFPPFLSIHTSFIHLSVQSPIYLFIIRPSKLASIAIISSNYLYYLSGHPFIYLYPPFTYSSTQISIHHYYFIHLSIESSIYLFIPSTF